MSFDLGSTVRLDAQCQDPGGALVTAASVTLTITLPDGTTVTPVVPDPVQVGLYRVDYVTTQAGQHAVRWLFTGPACAYTDMFDVRPAVPGYILSLAQAKRHLRITRPEDDEDLREWLESITEGIEGLAGAVVRRTITEVQDIARRGVPTMVLRHTPVLELTGIATVYAGGWTCAVADLDLDPATGTVRLLSGGWLYGPLRVTYIAGRAIKPPTITAASKIILRHLWRTRYGSSRALPSAGGNEDFSVTEPIPGFGYAIPNRALQLLEPFRLPPGTA